MLYAESRATAEREIARFVSEYRAKYPKAVASLATDQARLLTFINDQGTPAETRIIAIVNQHGPDRTVEEVLRPDLYFRLAVVPLSVPPLRTRAGAESFEGLCSGLVAEVAARLGVPVRTLSPEAVDALRAHPWPGNFRELENALERALVLGGATVPPEAPLNGAHFDFLEETIRGRASELARQALASGVGLDELDAAVMAEALEESRGNVAAAARRIGLSRRAFAYRQKRAAEPQE